MRLQKKQRSQFALILSINLFRMSQRMYSLAVVDDFAKPDLDDPVYSVELVQNNLPWPFVSLEIGIMIYSSKFLSAFLTLQRKS